ncbi:CRISPR-associated ring nuclease Csm6 [Pseudoalteromonas aurantia]|uniref:TIGR02584 family CRISPR-associated protein n=1 Tax=Pseudoalteromonas aurantia TaxID=43654 RepID=A0ABY2VUF4_9GAMM|nr:CRISPR-associated ring nuclease Csm6 [Pseudoalteromonas aurantia]TMO56520.1 TIGR02584 family CRISPR-associated protein [Pseudoalteromonas aurantia]TMO71918.1 TIGR02584 family CRISPR-associated protein [Pseudoalteromonas aurantia]
MSQTTKHILLIVTGASPQVLTETIFALNQQGKQLPEEVFVITTQNTKDMLVNGLFTQGHWQKLIDDYQLPAITFNENNIWLIEDDKGNPILDAKTEQEQTFMADFITRKVFELTNDNTLSIHASIAGGRKTMAFYLGYAMSLLGREQDSLSHVFVNDKFEFVPDFYYPTPNSRIVYNRNLGRDVDCKNAVVTLAEIPFVRMRKSIDQTLVNTIQNASFSQTVASLNSAHNDELELTINKKAKELKLAGVEIKLSAKEFAFYLWILEHSKANKQGLVIDRTFEETTEHVIAFLTHFSQYGSDSRVYTKYGLEPEEFRDGEHKNLIPMERDFVQQTRSQINKKIGNRLTVELAEKISIDSVKQDNNTHYFVAAFTDLL